MPAPMTVTRATLTADLKNLGLLPGIKVLVHCDLASLGEVEDGAEAVIDALLAVIGPAGTVLMPALSNRDADSPANPPVFDPARTPGNCGPIAEVFRQRPEAVRSLHPTHSVAAIGLGATALTSYHIASITPCDDLSPYGRLAALEDGFILLLGMTHAANLTLHTVEEQAGVPYHIQPGFARASIQVNGQRVERHYLLHKPGTPRAFDVLEPALLERGIQRNGMVGGAEARLIKAREMAAIAAQCLRADPSILVAQ
jgi:aminoglycoside 3-N-acetyltransferase